MDDLGAEHLSELSVASEKVVKSPDTVAADVAVPVTTVSDRDTRAIFGGNFVESSSKSDSKPVAAPRSRHKDRVILGSQNYHPDADEEEVSVSSSDGREKTDATPENVKKIDDVIQVAKIKASAAITSSTVGCETQKENHVKQSLTKTGINDDMAAGASRSRPNSMIVDDDESSASSAKQNCMAFTIDFGDNSTKEANSAAAAKYKSMVERFQNRHRRGASMSKLEGGEITPPSNSEAPTPTAPRSPRVPTEAPAVPPEAAAKVKMRPRDRSTSRVRDASKRHSWSPRSSTTEPPQMQQQNHNHPKATIPPKSPVTATPTTKTKLKSKPTPLQMPPPQQDMRKDRHAAKPFTPRSTAMQMALQKIDFLCPQPPLDDFRHLAMNDNVSEAGTYTLDGDNYTEEQKELMNIDKAAMDLRRASNNLLRQQQQQQRPKNLPLQNTQTTATNMVASSESRRRNNVLEVNYYHDAATTPYNASSKATYLEKIKSRVRSMTVKQQQQQQLQIEETSPNDGADIGTFTSVTTSGVLAKQSTLDSRPKLTRRSSLSTSQIDSSEYVSTEAKLKSNGGASYNGGYTDHQKAGYRLNVFTNQTDAQILSTIESPESPVGKLSDTAVLKTAQTKNDWIQEWARNARARSVASAIKCSPTKQSQQLTQQHEQHDLMSRSYNCTGEDEILTDDSLIYRNKTIDRFRLGELDYASDPNVSAQKPPKSPTKIPSPLHSIGRARSASHTRASLQNILQDDPTNTDLYLQKTAAAISNLQQSLSRKSSLKSPPSSRDSPKKLPLRHQHQYYSADEYSPQHSIEAKLLLTNPLNKRPTNMLMTNSYHEQLVLDVKIPRARKNSYDAQALTVSPARRHQPVGAKQQQYYGGSSIDQTRAVTSSTKHQQQSLSPLRRSSSFSAKCKATTNSNVQQKRPTATLYTPPAARHNYVAPGVGGTSAIKKSASSTTFRHVYSDYDDNVAYYINDEDDLIDVEYYGSSDEDIHSGNVDDDDYEEYNDDDVSHHVQSESVQSADVPLTNTRYNKALLMRIERSKQKVAGNTVGGNPPTAKLLAGGGMAACPNTPELPRRAVKSAPRSSMRQSMPRDSSLNRLAGHIPNSLASAKKQILQTANTVAAPSVVAAGQQSKRVQPKYMDISKYKPAQGNNFLRKNDAKSTLKPEIRRSPSSASMGLSRTDTTRASNRSVKSATSGRGTSAARRDASVTKQKEVELAMWKRRATYDPMRAAAEDRKKKEEAKKSTQGGGVQESGVTESSTVTRSQSFHYGVGSLTGTTPSSNQQSLENRWTLTSNESSDEERAYVSSSTNMS